MTICDIIARVPDPQSEKRMMLSKQIHITAHMYIQMKHAQ